MKIQKILEYFLGWRYQNAVEYLVILFGITSFVLPICKAWRSDTPKTVWDKAGFDTPKTETHKRMREIGVTFD